MRAMDSSVPPPVQDPAAVFPELEALRARSRGGELALTLGVLQRLRGQDPVDHAVATDVIATTDGIDDQLEELHATDPDDRELRTVLAGRGLRSTDALLRTAAEQHLVRLCAEDPADPTAWYLRVVSARDLPLPAAEAVRRYERLAAVVPVHVPAQRALLECLPPGPGETWDETLDLAGAMTEQAPDGSDAHALVPATHLAAWLARGPEREASALRVPGVLDAVEEADARFSAARCPSRYGWVAAHTEFAVYLGLAGRRASAAGHFRALGTAVWGPTWDTVRDHHDDLLTIREFALAEGRRR